MSFDVTSLSPDDLAALREALIAHGGGLDAQGRSPIRANRQLHDLNLKPTATDPRPTFFWSAEAPRDGIDLTKTTLYPRLMWHAQTGQEITVRDLRKETEKRAEGYLIAPPANAEAPDPMEILRAQFEALSKEDREALLESQKKSRLQSIAARLGDLPDGVLDALVASVAPATTEAKRGRA